MLAVENRGSLDANIAMAKANGAPDRFTKAKVYQQEFLEQNGRRSILAFFYHHQIGMIPPNARGPMLLPSSLSICTQILFAVQHQSLLWTRKCSSLAQIGHTILSSLALSACHELPMESASAWCVVHDHLRVDASPHGLNNHFGTLLSHNFVIHQFIQYVEIHAPCVPDSRPFSIVHVTLPYMGYCQISSPLVSCSQRFSHTL